MKWSPPPNLFRNRIATVNGSENARDRLAELSSLANSNLSFLETIQVDAALARTAQDAASGLGQVRLAVLSASTIDHLLPPIRVAGLRHGLRIETQAATYGQYRQELLDPASQTHAFRPDTVLLSLVAKDFIGAVPIGASADEADAALDFAVADLRGLWRHARQIGAVVIQQAFLDVEPPVFGGLDAVVPGAPARLVARLNAGLADAAYADGVLWLDVARASARDGLDTWFDSVRWLQAKMEIAHGGGAALWRYGGPADRRGARQVEEVPGARPRQYAVGRGDRRRRDRGHRAGAGQRRRRGACGAATLCQAHEGSRRDPRGLLEERDGHRRGGVSRPSRDGAETLGLRRLRGELVRQGHQPPDHREATEHRPRQPCFRGR